MLVRGSSTPKERRSSLHVKLNLKVALYFDQELSGLKSGKSSGNSTPRKVLTPTAPPRRCCDGADRDRGLYSHAAGQVPKADLSFLRYTDSAYLADEADEADQNEEECDA